MSYCGKCGARLVQGDPSTCPACSADWYRNSKPCAAALVEDIAGRVLLVRRQRPPFAACWDLPGGHCEFAEHPAEAAMRELVEETGLVVRTDEVVDIAVYRPDAEGNDDVTLTVYYRAEPVSGTERPDQVEVSELGWFGPHELPTDIAFDPPQGDVLRRWSQSVRRHGPSEEVSV